MANSHQNNEAPASQPVAAAPAIKTWQERTGNHPEATGEGNVEVAMCAEIAEWRAWGAALQQRQAPAPLNEFGLSMDPEARMLRAGRHLFDFAKRAGWPDDGEGAFEFVQRTSYAQGVEDGRQAEAAPAPAEPVAKVGLIEAVNAIQMVRRFPAMDFIERNKMLDLAIERLSTVAQAVAAEPAMTCPQCGVDRLKEPCPNMADECAMVADAHLLASPAAHPATEPSDKEKLLDYLTELATSAGFPNISTAIAEARWKLAPVGGAAELPGLTADDLWAIQGALRTAGKVALSRKVADVAALASRPGALAAPKSEQQQQFPHKACKTPGDCRKEGICFDAWNCALAATPATQQEKNK